MAKKSKSKSYAFEVYAVPLNGAQGCGTIPMPKSTYYRDEAEAIEMSESSEYWRKSYKGRVMVDEDLII